MDTKYDMVGKNQTDSEGTTANSSRSNQVLSNVVVESLPDGNLTGRIRDPPGQTCVYIPRGETASITYRLSTFLTFPAECPANPRLLAAAGFFFTGYKDRVKCFSCDQCNESWSMDDDVTSSRWHLKTCAMVVQEECGNIFGQGSISRSAAESRQSLNKSSSGRNQVEKNQTDSEGTTANNSRSNQVLSNVVVESSPDGNFMERARDLPGQRSVYIPPGDTAMESYRLSTFIRFPAECPANPRLLAAAGFFFTGFEDRVKCFVCARCVGNWSMDDDVTSSRWHLDTCAMVLQEECGNISIFGQGSISRSAAESRQSLNKSSSGRNQTFDFATIPSVHHENLVNSLELWKENERMRSFSIWPQHLRTVFPRDLARCGFFYLGNSDRVQCFSCGGELRNWNFEDNVGAEHIRHFPQCRMAKDEENRNIPMCKSERPTAPQRQRLLLEPLDPNDAKQRDLQAMFPCLQPSSAHMRLENSRLETFDHRWPGNQIQATPIQISRAGFFYLGERDRVKCWYCNGGLQNWKQDAEPWTEHAKWFPKCEFLLQRKGPDFVHQTISMFPNLPRLHDFDVPSNPEESCRRTFSPQPQLIDSKIVMHRMRAQVNNAMHSDLVRSAKQMGFNSREIGEAVKRNFELKGNMFASLDDLVYDLKSMKGNDISDEDSSNDDDSPQSTNMMATVRSSSSRFAVESRQTFKESSSGINQSSPQSQWNASASSSKKTSRASSSVPKSPASNIGGRNDRSAPRKAAAPVERPQQTPVAALPQTLDLATVRTSDSENLVLTESRKESERTNRRLDGASSSRTNVRQRHLSSSGSSLLPLNHTRDHCYHPVISFIKRSMENEIFRATKSVHYLDGMCIARTMERWIDILDGILAGFVLRHGIHNEVILKDIFYKKLCKVGWWYYIALTDPPRPVNRVGAVGYIMASMYVALHLPMGDMDEFFCHVSDYPTLFKVYCFCLNPCHRTMLSFFINLCPAVLCTSDHLEEKFDLLEEKMKATERFLDFRIQAGHHDTPPFFIHCYNLLKPYLRAFLPCNCDFCISTR